MKKTMKSFRITSWTNDLLISFCQKYELTSTEVINGALENYLAEETTDINMHFELLREENRLSFQGKLSGE